MCTGPGVTRQWGWLSSTLPAFINGYDKPALNAPEQRQQSALTMAEEDDARIRILQSLRGKICKSDKASRCFPSLTGGERGRWKKRAARGEAGGARRGVLSTVWRQPVHLVGSAGWCLTSS